MGIAFSCTQCGKPFDVARELAGKRGRCTQCGHVFTIPKPARAETPKGRPSPSGPPFADLAAVHDEEDAVPWSPSKPRVSAPPDRLASWARHLRVAWAGGLGLTLGLSAVALVMPASRDTVVGFVALLSFGLLLVSAIALAMAGFGESPAQGVLCLFVPFYSWYFAVRRWARLREFFCASLVGSCLAGLLFMLLPIARDDGAADPSAPSVSRSDRPDISPKPGDSEHERTLKRLLAAVQEVGDIFHRVKEQRDYLAAVPRLEALHAEAMNLRFPRSPSDEVRRLRKIYDEPLKIAVKRMDDEALRVYNTFHVPIHIPSFQFDMSGVLNTDAYFQTNDPPPPRFVNSPPVQPTPPAPPPMFPAPPPTAPAPSAFTMPSGPSVTVSVSGPIDDKTRDALNTELSAIANAMKKTPGSGVGWQQSGGRLTFTVTPVDDPRAFADRITIGKVTRVEGRRIELTVEKVQ